MEKLNYLIALLFVGGLVFLSACKEDDPDPIKASPTISVTPTTAGVLPGEKVDFTVTTSAATGAKVVSVKANDGTTDETVSGNTYSYTVPAAAAANATITITFTVTDDQTPAKTGKTTATITVGEVIDPVIPAGVISADRTLTSGVIWELDGRVIVGDGVTLTIEAGTIIKAHEGTDTDASVLIIARGGKIDAQGTAEEPIIMTSIKDNITIGEKMGTNLADDANSLWGGLIVLGKAPGSFKADATEVQIEGIPPSDTNGLYGGDNPTDNSGVIKYISIRHGGVTIGEGNEINGLTLGAVGSGTVIENVEVVANQDDGIEFFGGTVNPKNLLVWGAGDDGLDVDQAYSGTITNSMVILGAASDHGLEIDGGEGSATGKFTMDGITLIGNQDTDKGEYADFRSNAMGTTKNVYAIGFKDNSDVELDKENNVSANYTNGDLLFEKWEIVLPTGVATSAELFKDTTDPVQSTFTSDAATFSSAVTAGEETVGANQADFSWTFAKAKGAF